MQIPKNATKQNSSLECLAAFSHFVLACRVALLRICISDRRIHYKLRTSNMEQCYIHTTVGGLSSSLDESVRMVGSESEKLLSVE